MCGVEGCQVHGRLRYAKGIGRRCACDLPAVRPRRVLQLATELRPLPEPPNTGRQVAFPLTAVVFGDHLQ